MGLAWFLCLIFGPPYLIYKIFFAKPDDPFKLDI